MRILASFTHSHVLATLCIIMKANELQNKLLQPQYCSKILILAEKGDACFQSSSLIEESFLIHFQLQKCFGKYTYCSLIRASKYSEHVCMQCEWETHKWMNQWTIQRTNEWMHEWMHGLKQWLLNYKQYKHEKYDSKQSKLTKIHEYMHLQYDQVKIKYILNND